MKIKRRIFIIKVILSYIIFNFKNSLLADNIKLNTEIFLQKYFIQDNIILNINNLKKISLIDDLLRNSKFDSIYNLIKYDHKNNNYYNFDGWKITETEAILIKTSKALNLKSPKNVSIEKTKESIELLDYGPKKMCINSNTFIKETNDKFGAWFKFSKISQNIKPQIFIDNQVFPTTFYPKENLITISLNSDQVKKIVNTLGSKSIDLVFDNQKIKISIIDIIPKIDKKITWGIVKTEDNKIGLWISANCLHEDSYIIINNIKLKLNVFTDKATIYLPSDLLKKNNSFSIESNGEIVIKENITLN